MDVNPITSEISKVIQREIEPPPILGFLDPGRINPTDKELERSKYVYNNVTKKIDVELSSSGGIKYHGSKSLNSNDMCVSMLAVRHKKTNKITLYEIETMRLTFLHPENPDVTDNKESEGNDQLEKEQNLLGLVSKRKKRQIQENIKFRQSVGLVNESMAAVAENVDSSMIDIAVNNEDSNMNILPIHNRAATNVRDVYKLCDILSDDELESLHEITTKVLENPALCLKMNLTDYFYKRIKSVDKKNVNKIKLLLYIDSMIKFLQLGNKMIINGAKKKSFFCSYSLKISNKILNLFTIQSKEGRLRPAQMKDKCICYLIVACLLLFDFSFDVVQLSEVTKFALRRLLSLCKMVGAVKAKNTNIVTLKVPLSPLKSSSERIMIKKRSINF